ncbi:TPA: hypothetical protein ACK24L_000173 [Klebsiella oxytoca]
MMIPAGPDNKKAREKAGNKHEGNSNVGDDRKYPGWVWRPAALRQQCPDGLDYEPVIRSGHYLAGQEGFEPSTIRLPETTKPRRFRQGFFVHHAAT